MFKINNVEVEFDFFDMDDKEKFNKSFAKANDKIQALSSLKDDVAYGRQYCEAIIIFFESLFGAEKTFEIFEGKTNLRKSTLAVQALIEEKIRQDKELAEILEQTKNLGETQIAVVENEYDDDDVDSKILEKYYNRKN